jgi:hypothetical protein
MDSQEIGYKYVDNINLADNSMYCRDLVNTIMKLRVPWWVGNFLPR